MAQFDQILKFLHVFSQKICLRKFQGSFNMNMLWEVSLKKYLELLQNLRISLDSNYLMFGTETNILLE